MIKISKRKFLDHMADNILYWEKVEQEYQDLVDAYKPRWWHFLYNVDHEVNCILLATYKEKVRKLRLARSFVHRHHLDDNICLSSEEAREWHFI